MNEDNRQERIELYIRGELEPNALKDFEQQLAEDETLKQDVSLTKDVLDALDNVQSEQLLSEKLSALGDKYLTETEPTTVNKKSNKNRNIIIIALLIIAAIVSIFIWQKPVEPKAEQIFANYYEPYSSNTSTRGDDANEDYLKAIEAYDNENYSAAIATLTQRVAKYPDEITSQLLLGNSYLNVSPPQTPKAIVLFKNITERETNIYITTANWYLALAYLQNNQQNEAKAIFEDLSQNASGRYANLAKKILTE